jgi:signal transduction histidine kinase
MSERKGTAMHPALPDWEEAFRRLGTAQPVPPIRVVQGESCWSRGSSHLPQIVSRTSISGESSQEAGPAEDWLAAALRHLPWFSRTTSVTPHLLLLLGEAGVILHMETSCGADQRLGPALTGTEPAAAAAAPLALAGDELTVVLGSPNGCCPVHDRTALAVPLHERSGRVTAALELQVAVADAHPELLARLAHLASTVEGEMARRQAERELDSALRLARLASFTAHELATPLSALSTSLNMVAALAWDPDSSRAMARWRRLIEQMSAIVEDLRVLGSTERPHREMVRIPPLLRELTRTLELSEKFQLVLRDHADPDVALHGNAHLLRYALRNLVRNAVEAMPAGGRVGIDAETRGRTVRITVWDEGPGIAAEVQSALFDESFTTKAHGSGLGLRLVRTIVERVHGGKISYSANLPIGARFCMELPGVPTPPVHAAAQGGRETS